MNRISYHLIDILRDEGGAAFLEYSVLLGIVLVLSIAVVTAIGSWAGSIWQVICATVNGTVSSCSS
jgi:pilus assembly protein Flp/PilA